MTSPLHAMKTANIPKKRRGWPSSLLIILIYLLSACAPAGSAAVSSINTTPPITTSVPPGVVNSPQPASPTLASTNSPGLLFLGNKNIPPVVYLEGDTPTGVAVDIVHALAKLIPEPIEVKAMDWPTAQSLVVQGKADALIVINQTEERKKIYDFSDPLLESHFSIFTSSDRMGVTGLDSLRGMRVGVESGGLPQLLLQKDPQVQLIIIPNFLEGFKRLNNGTIDAVVVDYRVGSYVIAQNNLRNIKVAGDPISPSYSYFAVKKGNTRLLNEINTALQTIRSDGTYQKILDKWKPTDVVFQTQGQITNEIYFTTILIFFILIIIAVIWIVTIRKELSKRKEAEEKLKKQYSTLSGIIDNANALIFSVDRQYLYTSFNQAHADTIKAIYGADIQTGHSLFEYMTVEEDQKATRQNIDRALGGEQVVEESYSGETLLSRRYFQVSHSPIRSEGGVIGVAVLSQDITERRRSEMNLQQANEELDQRVQARTRDLALSKETLEEEIEERKQAEAALRESEEKYRMLFENKHTVMLLIDPNTGQIVDANPAACAFYGYSRQEINGLKISQINDLPEDLIEAEMEKARYEQRSYFNFKHRLANGEIRDVEVFSGPIVLDHKQLLYSVIHDDTERKKAENALKISEERYRILFEGAIEGIVQSTPQGKYINVNKSYARIFGYDSAEEMVDRVTNVGVQIYAHPEDRTRLLGLLASSDRVENFEAEGICKDGRQIWCSFNVNAIRNAQGETIRLDSRLMDITQRKLAEILLHQKTEELDRFFNIALDLLCIADTDGYFRHLNQAWETTLGYPLAELEGNLFLNYVHPDDMQSTLDAIAELSDQKPVINFINRYRCKDGTYRWIEWRSASFGKQIYAAARDITARKQVEEELLNAQAELETRVKERTAQLEAANRELEAFSYSISHDLRTPLRALDGFSGILLADYHDKLDEQAQDYLIRIRKASRHMWQLTEDLLALAHITRMPFTPQKVDLSALAREIAVELQSMNPQRKVNIEITPNMVTYGDPNLLKIMYENLLNNACKFTGQREQAHIQVGVMEQAGEMIYFVSDNGSGFDMAYAGKLFTPFQRLHNQDEFPGTGIGLVTVKRIITRHGGRIWPDAKLNQGATFYFALGEGR